MMKIFTQLHIERFILEVAFVLLGHFLIRLGLIYVSKRSSHFKQKLLKAIYSFLGWVTIYAIILLFLFHFSKEKWMFKPLYSNGDIDVSVFLIIVALIIISLVHKLVKLLTRYVLSPVYRYYGVEKGTGYTLNQIFYYLIMILALGISLSKVGIDITGLGAIFSVLGIGLGFGMRNIAGNFVSGIIILFERPVKVGEVVQIDGQVGRVEKIRLRSSVVRTANEGTLIVPNQYFIEHIIKNRTGAEMMAQVLVSIAYEKDTGKIEKCLREAADKIKETTTGILDSPRTDVRFVGIRNNVFDFFIEIPVANFEIKELVESKLRHSIVQTLSKADLKLAPTMFSPEETGNSRDNL